MVAQYSVVMFVVDVYRFEWNKFVLDSWVLFKQAKINKKRLTLYANK